MTNDTLRITPTTLVVFIDETGNEDFSDPHNPTFGRGGCAVLGNDYERILKRPWKTLKRERLGGANKAFHATAFEQSRPTREQISALNRFLRQPFWRFAVMADAKTALPSGVDGHNAVSMVTIRFIANLVAKYSVNTVALVFEASDRGNDLVKRDFDLARMQVVNSVGRTVVVDGYFMEKKYMEPGLEVADLVAHTAGRQRRHQIRGNPGVTKDFEQMYWHSPIPPAFMSIDNVQLNELSMNGTAS